MKGGIFSSSVGHKLVMSITGLFLMLFLLVHLALNSTLMLNDVEMFGRHWGKGEMFNAGAHFMISTPIIRIMEPLLAFGFIFHIVYATIVTIRNRRHRPIKYGYKGGANPLTTWPSKNMYILGIVILAFLILHVMNFFWKFRFGEMPKIEMGGHEIDNSYKVVKQLFDHTAYCIVYVIAAIALGLHLAHGFWSSFQTIGLNNKLWIARLRVISYCYAILIGAGFSSIPIYFLLTK